MTIKEARKHLGLKDTDIITINGVETILDSIEKQLKVWSITKTMREGLEIEKEACMVLLKEASIKWIKIDQKTGEPMKKGVNQLMPHDYISGAFRIINNSWKESRKGWVLTCNGHEVGRFDTLKQAKARAEEVEPLSEWI